MNRVVLAVGISKPCWRKPCTTCIRNWQFDQTGRPWAVELQGYEPDERMAQERRERIRREQSHRTDAVAYPSPLLHMAMASASLGRLLLPHVSAPLLRSPNRPSRQPLHIACQAKDAGSSARTLEIALAIGGLLSCPVIGISLYTLKTTGCGLPPGPGGSFGAAEGVSYLVVAGIVGWSLYTKAKTGSGLPAGPYGLLGAAEGFSFLAALAIIVVFSLQFFEQGYIPGPLPGDKCFG